jgi:hypothetical protein
LVYLDVTLDFGSLFFDRAAVFRRRRGRRCAKTATAPRETTSPLATAVG